MNLTLVENRRRINARQDAKGNLKFEITVEIINCSNEDIVKETNGLITLIHTKLKKRIDSDDI